MLALRVLVALGAVAFVAGAWIGWYSYELAEGEMIGIRAHHLAGTGWAWLAAVPLVLAAVAPFTTRMLGWLLLAPVPAIVAAIAAFGVDPGSLGGFPYFVAAETRRAWLPISFAGAGLAELALVWAFLAAPRARATRREVLRLAAAAAVAVLVVAGLNLRQVTAGGETEARFQREATRILQDCVGREGTVAVWCWADGRCAWEVETPDGASGGTFAEGEAPEDVLSCP